MFRFSREITNINPETVFMVGNFKITNTTLLSVFITILLLSFCFIIIRKIKVKPNKTQTTIEIIYEGMAGFITQITNSKKHTERIYPLIATIFVYIGISNLISLVPGLTAIQINSTPLFRSPTTDFNTTFGLALGAIFLLQIVSIIDWGFLNHLGKFFKFKEVYLGFRKGIKDGLMSIIDFVIGLMDIIGEIAKVVSLSLRLFGNMYAGEVLATLILSAFAFVLPITWSAMSILSGVVQALVFGSLITAYYMLAIKPEEGEA